MEDKLMGEITQNLMVLCRECRFIYELDYNPRQQGIETTIVIQSCFKRNDGGLKEAIKKSLENYNKLTRLEEEMFRDYDIYFEFDHDQFGGQGLVFEFEYDEEPLEELKRLSEMLLERFDIKDDEI